MDWNTLSPYFHLLKLPLWLADRETKRETKEASYRVVSGLYLR